MHFTVNGLPVETTPHPPDALWDRQSRRDGRHRLRFLLQATVKGGDDVSLAGPPPAEVDEVWVHFPFRTALGHLSAGNLRLFQRDST